MVKTEELSSDSYKSHCGQKKGVGLLIVKQVLVKAVEIEGILPTRFFSSSWSTQSVSFILLSLIFNSAHQQFIPHNETQMPQICVLCVTVWAHLNKSLGFKWRIGISCPAVGGFQLLASLAHSSWTKGTFSPMSRHLELTWWNDN